MNKISLHAYPVMLDPEAGENFQSYHIRFDFLLDSEKLYNYDVDIFSIADMLKDDSDYQHTFWTCDCGNPGCSGIQEMELVGEHDKDTISFKLSFPVSIHLVPEEDGRKFSQWRRWNNTRKVKMIRLDKNQIAQEVEKITDEIEHIMETQPGILRSLEGGFKLEHDASNGNGSSWDILLYLKESLSYYEKKQQKYKLFATRKLV